MAEKVYKCLNPVGIHDPIQEYPNAPRLDTIDGKNIYLVFGRGSDYEITEEIDRQLRAAYPKTNWFSKRVGPHSTKAGSIVLTEEERKTAHGVIRAVAW
jgi:hypothetical protein